MKTLPGKKVRKEITVLQSVTQWYLTAMCSIFLLLPAAGGYERIGDWAYKLWCGLSITYLAIIILTAGELSIIGGGPLKTLLKPLFHLSVPRLCLAGYIGWSLLSALLSPYDRVWLGLSRHAGGLTILLYGAIFWAVSSYGQWKDRFLWLLGLVTGINAGLGLLQYAGWNPLWMFPQGLDYHDAFVFYNGQFMGTLGNVDTLSAFLCLVVPLFYGDYLLSGRWMVLIPMGAGILTLGLAHVSSGFLGIAGAILLTIPIYFSRPRSWIRGAFAAGVSALSLGVAELLSPEPLHLSPAPLSLGLVILGISALVFAALASRRWPEPPSPARPRRRNGLWAGVAGAGGAGLAIAYCVPFPSGTAYELHALLHGRADASFGSGRLRIWQEVLRLIGERPLLGGGPDTLIARMGFTFTRYSPETGEVIESAVDAAHNEWLNIAVNQGLPALGAYLALLGTLAAAAIRRGSQVSVILWTALIGYLIQGSFTIGDCGAAALFWLFLALCERDSNHANYKEENKV